MVILKVCIPQPFKVRQGFDALSNDINARIAAGLNDPLRNGLEVETAKANSLKPYFYLRYLFDKLQVA